MAAATEPDLTRSDLIEVRRSNVHGLGVFAARRIPKGTRIIEYVGERVSHDEADRRYEEKDANDSHTFLFIVDSRTVIDAGVDGNDARFFNHSCDPNCESTVEKRRVYIEAIRDIEPGDELTYDYQIQREDDDPDNIDEVFACRCGFAQCRGTMLWPTERKPKTARKKTRRKSGSKTKSERGSAASRAEAASASRTRTQRGRSRRGRHAEGAERKAPAKNDRSRRKNGRQETLRAKRGKRAGRRR